MTEPDGSTIRDLVTDEFALHGIIAHATTVVDRIGRQLLCLDRTVTRARDVPGRPSDNFLQALP
ncbi:hypothetical protein [Burkholderia sp. PU8-34]